MAIREFYGNEGSASIFTLMVGKKSARKKVKKRKLKRRGEYQEKESEESANNQS